MKIPIFPGKYHQNGGFSMAMLVYRRVRGYEAHHCPLIILEGRLRISWGTRGHWGGVPGPLRFLRLQIDAPLRKKKNTFQHIELNIHRKQCKKFHLLLSRAQKTLYQTILQCGPLPVINGVINLISRVITPVTHSFSAIYRGYKPIYNW